MTKILIDCTLTGGRGPAKKVAEFIWECNTKKIEYFLLSDKKLQTILDDFGIKSNKVLDIGLNNPAKKIYKIFKDELENIDFDLLVKFGARTPGPYVCRQLNKPYIIVDGGLPDKYEKYPSLYDTQTYKKALRFILTSNFPYKPPPSPLSNIEVVYFPISYKTNQFIDGLKQTSRKQILKNISSFLTPFPKNIDLIINLNMTDDYVLENSRTTYGAWLTCRQYDQVVGFIRRLITDLGEQFANKRIALISDKAISKIGLDLYNRFPNIFPVTWKKQWSYYTEIALDAVSDITLARAANYQPFIFALARGNNVTTAVPADGYMNEDLAAKQASSLKLTVAINYDDDRYVQKIIAFYGKKDQIKLISSNQKTNYLNFANSKNFINYFSNLFKNL